MGGVPAEPVNPQSRFVSDRRAAGDAVPLRRTLPVTRCSTDVAIRVLWLGAPGHLGRNAAPVAWRGPWRGRLGEWLASLIDGHLEPGAADRDAYLNSLHG